MTRSWTLTPGHGSSSLALRDTPLEEPGFGEVRVAIKASSVNARDLMIAAGHSPMPAAEMLIPLSDGAGVVEAVGEGVSRVAVGDRVVIAFNPAHQTGAYEPWMEPSAHGAVAQGMLREGAVFNEMALVRLPSGLSFEQAACLPCAGVVAWNALFEAGPFTPGITILATGTGGVSLVALRLAKMAGARFGVTSSDEEKLTRAEAMGADFGVNYRARADWDQAVKEATDGQGAHIILENAGPPSVATSIRAAAQGGRVAQIGWKAFDGPPPSVIDMALGGVSLAPVMVGSRAMLEKLVAAVALNGTEMPVHETVPFDAAPQAFHAMESGDVFGKVVITH